MFLTAMATPTRDDHLASCYLGPIGALSGKGFDAKRSDWRDRSPPGAGTAGQEQPHDHAKP